MTITGINYAEQYLTTLLQSFPYVLYFGELFNTPANGRYEFTGPSTIQIPNINVNGRKDGNMDQLTTKGRNFGLTYKTLELTRHRTWDTLLHPEHVNRTNGMATIANATQVMNQEEKFPEMSAYLVSKLFADYVEAGKNVVTTTLTVNNILSVFDDMMVSMDDARVPRAGRILYTTPGVGKLLKEAADLQRSFAVQTGNQSVQRQIANLDNVKIVDYIPTDIMKTAYDFSSGWAVGATARQINMMLVHPDAVITPIKYTFAGLDEPSAAHQGKYYYFEESFEDVFLLPLKEGGIVFHADADTATYTAVQNPTGNPKTLGYYVLSGNTYILTEDEAVVAGTTYYTKS